MPRPYKQKRCRRFPLDKDIDRRRILNSFVGRTGAGLDEPPHESHPKYEALLANSVCCRPPAPESSEPTELLLYLRRKSTSGFVQFSQRRPGTRWQSRR